jgi:hypothetical protein
MRLVGQQNNSTLPMPLRHRKLVRYVAIILAIALAAAWVIYRTHANIERVSDYLGL